jgi:hypothetical protein
MFEKVINELKKLDLIEQDDIVIAGMDKVSASTFVLFGAIDGAVAASGADRRIIAANKNSIRVFDVDKKTGEYLWTYSKFNKEEIRKLKAGLSLGSFGLTFKTGAGCHEYSANKKFQGYDQKEQLNKMKELFDSNFKDA